MKYIVLIQDTNIGVFFVTNKKGQLAFENMGKACKFTKRVAMKLFNSIDARAFPIIGFIRVLVVSINPAGDTTIIETKTLTCSD